MSVRVSKRSLIPVLLFVAAFIATAFQYPTVRLGPGFETLAIARNLAAHGQFANPFSPLLTGPTAHAAPLYPAFLALLIWTFGNSVFFALAVNGITMVVHSLHAALLPAVSQLFFRDRRPGIWAAAVTIILPVFFLFPQYEIMYVAVGLMLFCLVTRRLARRDGIAPGLASGIGIGLLALLNPASVTVAVLWLVYLLWRHRPSHTARFACCAALAAAGTLVPWTWRNYRQFNSLIFVRDNLGLELHLANNDLAEGSFALNEANGVHRLMHPGNSDTEGREFQTLGETEYYRSRGALASDWIRLHPARFVALTAARVRMFWFPDADDSRWYSRSISFVTITAAMGMLLLARRRDPIIVFIAGALFTYPLLYYFVQSDPRYRTPILWLPLLAGGYLLSSLTRRTAPAEQKVTHTEMNAGMSTVIADGIPTTGMSPANTHPTSHSRSFGRVRV
jgi:hypothetical protein